jgi:hypothetical protein
MKIPEIRKSLTLLRQFIAAWQDYAGRVTHLVANYSFVNSILPKPDPDSLRVAYGAVQNAATPILDELRERYGEHWQLPLCIVVAGQRIESHEAFSVKLIKTHRANALTAR